MKELKILTNEDYAYLFHPEGGGAHEIRFDGGGLVAESAGYNILARPGSYILGIVYCHNIYTISQYIQYYKISRISGLYYRISC